MSFPLLVLSLALVPSLALAKSVNNRQERQEERIENGIRDGELTTREAMRLEQRQEKIAEWEAKARADGDGLSEKEKAKLQQKLNRASQGIHGKKHNNREPGQVGERQLRQDLRIDNGSEKGMLTASEEERLRKMQERIAAKEAEFKADGNFTDEEKAKIAKAQEHASKLIYRKKHNGRKPVSSSAQ